MDVMRAAKRTFIRGYFRSIHCLVFTSYVLLRGKQPLFNLNNVRKAVSIFETQLSDEPTSLKSGGSAIIKVSPTGATFDLPLSDLNPRVETGLLAIGVIFALSYLARSLKK